MMARELLVELGCEEIPARWMTPMTRQLHARLSEALTEMRLVPRSPLQVFATPRRLVAVTTIEARQAAVEEVVQGPPVSIALDADGRYTPAATGFARKLEVDVSTLTRVRTAKGEYLVSERRDPGERAAVVLPAVLTTTLRRVSFPKQMNWDATAPGDGGPLAFGRPIRWIVFLFGGEVVPFEIGRSAAAASASVRPVKAGRVTYGHRFFSKSGRAGRPLSVRSFADYKKALTANYVILERERRQARIVRKLETGAARVDGRVAIEFGQSDLLDELPDLVEYPSVVTGTFPAEFLELPDEVLTTTMVHHQHYVPVGDSTGRLTAHFLAVTNTPRDNVARIARNAERVLAARLRDARFFWEADRRLRLEDRLPRLETVRFHQTLGSYRAKAERTSQLAATIATDELACDATTVELARRAGLLCKADLATEMVGEFPELQGIMGGVYAREQGEPAAVWKAIYHHYLPVGIEAEAPPTRRELGEGAPAWAAVALADKLDTLVGLFHAGEKPTGSRDPFGMRRHAQGIVRLLIDLPELTGLEPRIAIGGLLEMAARLHGSLSAEAERRQTDFVRERVRYLLEERGFDIRNVRSVTGSGSLVELRPLDARRKLEVLPEFTDSPGFRQLATLFKRVKNIARELPDPEYTRLEESPASPSARLTEPAERQLLDELERRGAVVDQAVATGQDFRAAFAEASLFGPAVDRFFVEVYVMVDDPDLRAARLWLMKRLERTVGRLADVSEIVAQEDTT